MLSMIIWVLALTGSIATVCLAVAFDAERAHLAATALVTLGIVAAAVNEHRSAEMAGASQYALAALASRYMGLLWAWSAVATYVVFAFIVDWPHWMATVVAMIVGCGLCLFVAAILDREEANTRPDRRVPVVVDVMAKAQFALGAVLLGVLLAVRRSAELGGQHKWVALNLVLGTAAGLLTLTGYLLMRRSAAASSVETSEAARA